MPGRPQPKHTQERNKAFRERAVRILRGRRGLPPEPVAVEPKPGGGLSGGAAATPDGEA
jgi:hypothetical protein